MTFPTAAARDAAIPNPADGMVAFCDGQLWVRSADGVWLPVVAGTQMANGIVNGGFETGDLYGWRATNREGQPAEGNIVVQRDDTAEGGASVVMAHPSDTDYLLLQSAIMPRTGIRPLLVTCVARHNSGPDSYCRLQVVNMAKDGSETQEYPQIEFTAENDWALATLAVPASPTARYFAVRFFTLTRDSITRVDDFRVVHSTGTHAAT